MSDAPSELLHARETSYRGFVIGAAAAVIHVTILMASLALAILGDVPVIALIFFLIGHFLLALGIVRVRAHQKAQDRDGVIYLPARPVQPALAYASRRR